MSRRATAAIVLTVVGGLVFFSLDAYASITPTKKPELRMMSGCSATPHTTDQIRCGIRIWNDSNKRRAISGSVVVQIPVGSTLTGPMSPTWMQSANSPGKISWRLPVMGLTPQSTRTFGFNLKVSENRPCIRTVLLSSHGVRLLKPQNRCTQVNT